MLQGIGRAHFAHCAYLDPYPCPGVLKLIGARMKEQAEVGGSYLEAHLKSLELLKGRLQQTFEDSGLPEEPREAAAQDRFLVGLRLRGSSRELS